MRKGPHHVPKHLQWFAPLFQKSLHAISDALFDVDHFLRSATFFWEVGGGRWEVGATRQKKTKNKDKMKASQTPFVHLLTHQQ